MLTLKFRSLGPIPIEAEAITPNALQALPLPQIERLPLRWGNRLIPLAEAFDVSGDPTDGVIEVLGDMPQVKRLGEAMTSGHLRIVGNAGWHVGAGMRGGRIDISGNVGDWLGAEMKGGIIRVHGSAGNLVGAAYRGSRRGMSQGTIVIDGNAGHELAATMRRGLIVVAGNVGDFAGAAMIAGTLVVGGTFGQRPGVGLKRGSIIALGERPTLIPSYRLDCHYEPTYLRLLWQSLQKWQSPLTQRECTLSVERWSGDLLTGGRGEIWLAR